MLWLLLMSSNQLLRLKAAPLQQATVLIRLLHVSESAEIYCRTAFLSLLSTGFIISVNECY